MTVKIIVDSSGPRLQRWYVHWVHGTGAPTPPERTLVLPIPGTDVYTPPRSGKSPESARLHRKARLGRSATLTVRSGLQLLWSWMTSPWYLRKNPAPFMIRCQTFPSHKNSVMNRDLVLLRFAILAGQRYADDLLVIASIDGLVSKGGVRPQNGRTILRPLVRDHQIGRFQK